MIPLRDDIPSRGRPHMVRLLILANLVGFALQQIFGREFTEAFALTPTSVVGWWQGDGKLSEAVASVLPLLSSQFLHAGWLHLGSNLLFLWIFADNVEGEIGSGRFLGFYLVCGVLAGLCHVYFESTSSVPTIGASGAIAGVLGAYFVRFPHARVLTLVPIFILPLLIEIPAVIFLGLWFVLQILYVVTDTGGQMAVWAHAGGFVAGMVLVGVLPRVRQRGPKPRYRTVPHERIR